MLIRIAATNSEQSGVARECGSVPALVGILHHGPRHPVTLVALEALACLLAQEADARVCLIFLVETSNCTCSRVTPERKAERQEERQIDICLPSALITTLK